MLDDDVPDKKIGNYIFSNQTWDVYQKQNCTVHESIKYNCLNPFAVNENASSVNYTVSI
jgi:quinolinate synthase